MSFASLKPHLIVTAIFLALSLAYSLPALQGKQLAQHDIVQGAAAQEEARQHYEETGEISLWHSRMFGGMPGYLIYSPHEKSITTYIGQLIYKGLPQPANLIFLYLIGFYILMISLRTGPWLGLIGAIAFAFASYNFIIIEAGHFSKSLALAFAPPLLAGIILTFRGRYWLGAGLTAFFLAMELYANHLQITYYLFLTLLVYGIVELVRAVRAQRLAAFGKAVAVLLPVALVAVGTQTSRLWSLYEYSKLTIRGPSELTADRQAGDGLDRGYAFDYSNGLGEAFTLLVPNFYGGASQGELSTRSSTFQALVNNNVPRATAVNFVQRLPLYWGDQPFVSGPAYAGAVVCLLFVFGLFVLRDELKGWAVAAVVVLLLFSFGKNLAWFNDLFFDYFPYFNKFRAHTMTVALVQLFACLVGVLALRDLLAGRIVPEKARRGLLLSSAIVGGLALLFALLGGAFFDFSAEVDSRMQLPPWLLAALREDRQKLLQLDAFRSLLFIGLATGLLYFYLQKKVPLNALLAGLAVLLLVDLWPINKRYLNAQDFVPKRERELAYQFRPSAADQEILRDTTDFRVMDMTVSTFNDAGPSYHHRTIGGYHAAKLRRYQDLISRQISQQNMGVLNMLNTKYFVVPGQDGQPPRVQRNSNAYGPAWLVERYRLVPNADAEMAALDTLDTRREAVVDERFADQLAGLDLQPDPTARIAQVRFAPNRIVYRSQAAREQLAVFSEIYYNEYGDWQVRIDDEVADHFRANYVLRAMRIPPGEHTITFEFWSRSYQIGGQVDFVCSVLLLLVVTGSILGPRLRRPRAAQPVEV